METRTADAKVTGGARRGQYWSQALKSLLDHIPITSVSGAHDPSLPALELRPEDSVWDAINRLYNRNVSGAAIVDDVRSSFKKFVDRDIGFVEFAGLLLWSTEELHKVSTGSEGKNLDFFSSLKQHPQIAQTKIAELAKLFLWEPFFPVQSHETLFQAMLLFSKHHRLNVVPVIESSNSAVVGFVTQNAVLELLLQSSGLEWLDKIADKQLCEYRFENGSRSISVYSDQTLADALHILSEEKIGVAVIDRKTRSLVGSVQCSDLHLLLDDSSLFNNRKTLSAKEFVESKSRGSDKATEHPSASNSQSILSLRTRGQPRTAVPDSNRTSDTLKQAMEKLTASNSSCSFMVDDHGRVQGVVTTRDIISIFSPPCMDSRIDGGTFFSSALQQAGCRVENGEMIQDS